MILKALIQDDHPFTLGLQPYHHLWCRSNTHGMPLASPSTKVEYEYCFLTTKRFSFRDTIDFKAFLDRLSIYQRSLLRCIEIDTTFMDRPNIDDWVVCCALLPPGLASVHYVGEFSPYYVRNIGEDWYLYEPKELSWGLEGVWIPEHIEKLNLLGKSVRRSAAKAKLSLEDRRRAPVPEGLSGEKMYRVFDEVDPWGEDWLEWWEEDRKVALNGGQGLNTTT